MSATPGTPFTLCLTYWPRRAGYRWWAEFDRAEVREDLQQIRSFGLTQVRFCLMWEHVQPATRKVHSEALRALEQALDIAGEVGLKVIPALFPIAIDGALFLPRWAANPDPLDDIRQIARTGMPFIEEQADQPRVLYEGGYRANKARNLFSDAAMIEAQRYLVHEVVGYFGSHPSIGAWQLGEGLERVHTPDSSSAVYEWFATMVEAARTGHPDAHLIGVTSVRGLTTHAGPRPEHIATTCNEVGLSVDVPLPVRGLRPFSLNGVEFVYELASGLAGQPVTLFGLGQPTAPDNHDGSIADVLYDQRVGTYLASREAQAEYLGEALERVRKAGARGVVLSNYSDFPATLWRNPPLDHTIRSRTLGLIGATGREKPAVEVVRAFAEKLPAPTSSQAGGTDEQAQKQQPAVSSFGSNGHASFEEAIVSVPYSVFSSQIDPERYWHNPQDEFQRLWRVFADERDIPWR